jgi:hypothetical protein
MKDQEPNPAAAKEQAEGSRENVNQGSKKANAESEEFQRKTGLDGKNDSGPEPEVHKPTS